MEKLFQNHVTTEEQDVKKFTKDFVSQKKKKKRGYNFKKYFFKKIFKT